MSAAASAVRDERVERLRRRIEAYARYASIMHAQVEALDAGDLARFESLTADRRRIAAEVDADGGRPGHGDGLLDHGAGDAAIETLILAARRELMRCLDADRRIDERLRAMRSESLERLRGLESNQQGIQSYTPPESQRHALDVRY